MHAFIMAEYEQLPSEELRLNGGLVEEERERRSKQYDVTNDIKRAIREGRFTVIYATDKSRPKMVLIHEWDSRVRPGWKVELQLDDDSRSVQERAML